MLWQFQRNAKFCNVQGPVCSLSGTALNTRLHPQGEEEESRTTGTVAIQIAAEPQEQPVLVQRNAPIQKKKFRPKQVCLLNRNQGPQNGKQNQSKSSPR